jgi:hypothetical protein
MKAARFMDKAMMVFIVNFGIVEGIKISWLESLTEDELITVIESFFSYYKELKSFLKDQNDLADRIQKINDLELKIVL